MSVKWTQDVFRRPLWVFRTLIAILLSSTYLTALQPDHSLTQYAHVAWSTLDRRLPGSVPALAQLADGSLWVATEFGIVRFDGVTFLPWKPPAGARLATITALAPTASGGLWIGTRAGLFRWHAESFEKYPVDDNSEQLAISTILADRAGNVWVAAAGFHSGGLCQVQMKSLHCYGPAEGFSGRTVLSLFEDRSGSLWAGANDGLYQRKAGIIRHWQPSGISDRTHAPIDSMTIDSIAQGSGELILATNEETGLVRFEEGVFARYGLPNKDQIVRPRTLLRDRDGALWIGTNGQGLVRLYQGRMDRFSHADGLSGDVVLNLLEDREGNIWAATDRGLDRFRDVPLTTISKREGLSADTAGSVVACKGGGVWIGTDAGLNHIGDGKITIYDKHDGLPTDSITSLFEDRSGILWADTPDGLAYSAGARFKSVDLPGVKDMRYIAAAAEDRNGSLWFSDLERGLVRLDPREVIAGKASTRSVEVSPWTVFDGKEAWALEADPGEGGLWLGFKEGGIAYYAKGHPIRRYSPSEGLPAGPVTDLHLDREGALWIATASGLSRLLDGRIATLTTANGLPCDAIHAIVEGDDDAIWMNTACGLVRLARRDLTPWYSDPRAKVDVKVFGAADGMRVRSSASGYFRSAAKSADGRLWFPVLDGVAVVDPGHLLENRLPPPVQIDRITGDGDEYPIASLLKLRPHTRDLQIDYTAFSFVAPEQVRFKYMLEGYDTRWKDAGTLRQAVYTNLPPRRYRFRVTAENNDGVWNQAGASLDFSIRPAFYQTAWFLGLCIAAFSLALWMGYRLRVRQIAAQINVRFEERVAERTRIARELHDTLLQNIAGFALQLDGLSKTVKEPAAAKDRLHDLRLQAEEWLHEARESVWDLRARIADGQDFGTAVRTTVQPIALGRQVRLDIAISGSPQALPARLQAHLLRISQEAVRNAIQHGHAKEIKMEIVYTGPEQIRIQIRDDGLGFDLEQASAQPGHWGLATMRERAEKIAADLRISTFPGNGTEIEIVAPIGRQPDRES